MCVKCCSVVLIATVCLVFFIIKEMVKNIWSHLDVKEKRSHSGKEEENGGKND